MFLAIAVGCARVRPAARAVHAEALFTEPFDQLDPAAWREIDLKGKTAYAVLELEGERILKAESRAQASILLRECRFDPSEYPWLSWRWRVDQFIEDEDLRTKEGSDAPARVYVYFETAGLLVWQKRSVDYVWSAVLPTETLITSPFFGLSKMLVAESGRSAQGRWRSETRNLVEDFRRCFGKKPPDVVAIGLMTDTDSTGGEAVAYFDDVQISRTRPTAVSSE